MTAIEEVKALAASAKPLRNGVFPIDDDLYKRFDREHYLFCRKNKKFRYTWHDGPIPNVLFRSMWVCPKSAVR